VRELPRGGRRTLVTTIALVIVSFVLMTFDLRASGEGVGGTLRNGAQAVFSPVQGLVGRAIAPVIDVVDGMANLAGLREENALLRAELQQMRTRVARVDELESQVALLQQAQDLELDREDITQVTANVLGGSDPLDLSFSIDRGTADGVLVGNPVIDPGGNVVGVVTDVFEGGARVLPLVAPTEAVGVTVGAETGVVTGSGNPNRMELEILEATGPLGEGDVVVTGNTTSYPAGLTVGTVVSAASPEAAYLATQVRPLADVTRLRVVIVLGWPLPGEPGVTASTTEGGTSGTDDTTDTTVSGG
jgi:rod shape-determining protein MreC